ncbi:MAG: response regulator transcription factor [Bacteroidales bacterium]|nr:response regulator transcription factor [Bacteroidales bacterium]MBK8883758.1 response regulator transcription factor [Bacteroidales bacterium]
MIRTLIIEDEQPAAFRLEKLLRKLQSDIEVLAIIDTVESAVRWFESNPPPDLIMLDIQLGDGISFDIFSKIKVESYVIFTTAYDEYAIRAFELNSIDYLLKPVSEAKLSQSIEKFRKFQSLSQTVNIRKLLETIENRNDKFKKRFVVSIANKIKVVETGEIAYLYSREKNTFLCTVENHHYPLEFSLDNLELLLNPELFFRVNRQYIVQYRVINRISILSKSRIRIDTVPPAGEEILVSTARTTEFRHWLDR